MIYLLARQRTINTCLSHVNIRVRKQSNGNVRIEWASRTRRFGCQTEESFFEADFKLHELKDLNEWANGMLRTIEKLCKMKKRITSKCVIIPKRFVLKINCGDLYGKCVTRKVFDIKTKASEGNSI